MSSPSFPCTYCGACCANAFLLVESGLVDVPLREDGSCAHLTAIPAPGGRTHHICRIYDSRPDACRLNKVCPPDEALSSYYQRTSEACNILQTAIGIDESYRVDASLIHQAEEAE